MGACRSRGPRSVGMREAASSLSRAIGLLREMPSRPIDSASSSSCSAALVSLSPIRSARRLPKLRRRTSAPVGLSEKLGDRKGRFRAVEPVARLQRARRIRFRSGAGRCAPGGGPGGRRRRSRGAGAPCAVVVDVSAVIWKRVVTTWTAGLALYEVHRHGTQALTFGGHDARECALSSSSTSVFLIGYPERALARNAEGVAHALALGQPQVVAHAHNGARCCCSSLANSQSSTAASGWPRGSPTSTGSPSTTPKRASWPHGAPFTRSGISGR